MSIYDFMEPWQVAIVLLPLYALFVREFLAKPMERLIRWLLPKRIADFLTKEHGDDRKKE